MIQVTEAICLVEAQAHTAITEQVPLLQASGRVLAEPVYADRDFPPFDRVMMDGIAIRKADFDSGIRSFRIASQQAAGSAPHTLSDAGSCIEIMTGAVLPINADSIVPYEDCTMEDGIASIKATKVRTFQNVHLLGSDTRSGEEVLGRYQRITPAAIGILASAGMHSVPVIRLPKIAICSTGDELVEIDASPLPYQIRRSNSYMLAAALLSEGITADLHHLPDERRRIEEILATLLPAYDVLLFSGAVSKGKFDFLPEALQMLGMKTIFHRIAQKPGKPMLFGSFPAGPVVFGFPGNPASTLVCYEIYFKAWLRKMLHQQHAVLHARLSEDLTFDPPLSYHLLVTLNEEEGMLIAVPCPAANSGDMPGLQRADAILTLPPERQLFKAGEVFPITLLRTFQSLPSDSEK